MSKLSIDKHAPVATNSQNPYDFNGVSVSQIIFISLPCFSQNLHPAATKGAQLGLEDNKQLELLNNVLEPLWNQMRQQDSNLNLYQKASLLLNKLLLLKKRKRNLRKKILKNLRKMSIVYLNYLQPKK